MALINVEEDIKSSWKNTAGRKKIHYFKLSSFSHLFYQPSPLLNNPVLLKKKLCQAYYLVFAWNFEKLFTKLLTNNRLRVGLTLGTLPLHNLLWSHTGGVKIFI